MNQHKNKHKGERLFVVGNGASLSQTPLHLLKDEYTFGMNRIGLIFDKTEWRPNYFFCITYRVKSKEYREDVYKVIKTGIPCFIGNRIKQHVYGHKNIEYVDCLHIGKSYAKPNYGYWDMDISTSTVSVYGQSLFSVMQIAVYMGFSPIYILGIEGYKPNKNILDSNHFDFRYETPKQRHSLKWFNSYGLPTLVESHKLIYRGTKDMGVEVFDATVGGGNSPYPKVKLEDIL